MLEYDSVNNKADIKNKRLNLVFNQLFFINSNLPNFENINGTYLHKGYGGLTSFIFTYENENFFISAEPRINLEKRYHLDKSTKTKSFSVLNDISLGSQYNNQNIKNLGIKFKITEICLLLWRWSHWWGPGIYNSLLSNNKKALPFYLKTTILMKLNLKLSMMLNILFQTLF